MHLPISKKRPLTLESQMLHFQAAAKLAAFENSPSFIMRNLSTDGQNFFTCFKGLRENKQYHYDF